MSLPSCLVSALAKKLPMIRGKRVNSLKCTMALIDKLAQLNSEFELVNKLIVNEDQCRVT